jgi:hypothetical protein
MATASGTAAAQEAKPPLLVVRPSGIDQQNAEARAREDRLYRRMRENDYLFRNICVQCGGGVNRAGANAPFNPIQALGPGQRGGLTDEGGADSVE